MRRNDREVTDMTEILEIIKACDVCRLGLNDPSGYPYILPLNFGFKEDEGIITLYFHGAMEGYKYRLMELDNRVSFEMETGHELYSDKQKGYCTMNFKSIMGRGKIQFVEDDDEKFEALTILTDHYHLEHFEFNPNAIPRTKVMKLVVSEMTAKSKVLPKLQAKQ